MPVFRYRALRASGTEIAGELAALDEHDVASRLQRNGSFPIEISALADGGAHRRQPVGQRRLPARELVLFTRQLAALMGAGVMPDRSLGMIAAARGRVAIGRLAAELLSAINRGESLSQACRGTLNLPPHYAMIIAAGEAHGDLGGALERLAEIVQRSRTMSRALLDALIYPISVLVVGIVSISFLLGFVVPRFEALLTSVQRDPPFAMSCLLALSKVFQLFALPSVLIAMLVGGAIIFRYRDAAFRLAFHRRLLHLPWLGALIEKLEAERLLYLLGHMVSARVELPAAIAATRAAMTSEAFSAGLLATEQGIARGDRLATALTASGVIPEIASELVRVGDETGDLAAMLLKAAEILRQEFEVTSMELIGLVTPVSIILLGLLIGGVAVTILGSIIEVYDLAL